jgi:hypothetical protein
MSLAELFENADVISCYTRAQAIEDGVLIDLSALAPDVCRQHYKHPIACTAAVWAMIEAAVNDPDAGNDVAGVVHDLLWMSRMNVFLRPDASTVLFTCLIVECGRPRERRFKLVVGPGDYGEAVITLSLTNED